MTWLNPALRIAASLASSGPASEMVDFAPEARPSGREVERRCGELLREVNGPLLRDWAEHEAYMREMYEGPRTSVGDDGRAAAASVMTPTDRALELDVLGRTVDLSWLPRPAAGLFRRLDPQRAMFTAVRTMTIGWLPPHLREAYGLDWSPPVQRRAAVFRRVLRTAMQLQPPRMRRAAGYLEAYRRLGLPARL